MGPHLWMLRCMTKHLQQIGGWNQQTSNSTIYSELMPIDFIISPILDIEWGSPQDLVQWTKWIYFTVMGCFSPNWLDVNNVNISYPGTPPTAPPSKHEFAQIFVARVSHEASAFGRHGQPRHITWIGRQWLGAQETDVCQWQGQWVWAKISQEWWFNFHEMGEIAVNPPTQFAASILWRCHGGVVHDPSLAAVWQLWTNVSSKHVMPYGKMVP